MNTQNNKSSQCMFCLTIASDEDMASKKIIMLVPTFNDGRGICHLCIFDGCAKVLKHAPPYKRNKSYTMEIKRK